MTIVAMWLIDHVGRRPLLLTGIAGMVVTLGMLSLTFYIRRNPAVVAWLAVISMMAYVALFAISLGPIFWLLISEILSARKFAARAKVFAQRLIGDRI